MGKENQYHCLKGFMSDTAKSFELGSIELLDFFGGHTVKLSFDPFLHPCDHSCKKSIGVGKVRNGGFNAKPEVMSLPDFRKLLRVGFLDRST